MKNLILSDQHRVRLLRYKIKGTRFLCFIQSILLKVTSAAIIVITETFWLKQSTTEKTTILFDLRLLCFQLISCR